MYTIFRKTLLIALAVVLFGAAHTLLGQSTGNIRGTVTDATGATVPGAAVTVTSPDTGFTRTQQSNGEGIFVFPDLPIGSYALQITKAGFETQKRSAQQLLTGQTIGLDIKLSVGTRTESIEVSTDTQEVQTSTSEIASTVDVKQMQDLPLNQRNPLDLTALTPGTTLTTVGTESGQQDQTGLVVNGLRATQNNFQLDGAIYENRFFDSVPILPSPDALQEFTIQAADFSAKYAGAGGLVQLSSRSGTNQIHGRAFEFFRNTVLNAPPYNFNYPSAIRIPPYKLNQFGGTVGGPVVIPHLYNGRDKTFFFFSAEDLQRRAAPTTATIYVPTAAELSGDFSAFLPDNAAGQAVTCRAAREPGFPLSTSQCKQITNPFGTAVGNKINTAANQLSANVAKQYTLGLSGVDPVTGGYVTTQNKNIDSTQYLIKIDHNLADRNHLSGRYFYNQDNYQRPFSAPLGFYAGNFFRNQALTISDTQTFSNTLTGTVYATAARFARTQIPEAPGLQSLQQLGSNVPLGTNVPIFPGIRSNISGYVNIFSGGALTQAPTEYEFKAEATKLLGHHTLGFGFTYERDEINATDYSYTPGDNTFNGSRTGLAISDFYFGLDSVFYQDNGRKFYLRQNEIGIYATDDWKATKQLTINMGLRWDPWLPSTDNNGTLVGFTPGVQSSVAPNAPLGLQFVGDNGLQSSVFQQNLKDFAPRVGFAYDVGGRGDTVVRGAYGIFYGFPEGLLYQRTDATQPVDLFYQINSPAGAWDNVYAGIAGGDPFPRNHVAPSQFGTYKFILPVSGGVLNPGSKVESTQAYNLVVEQKLGAGFAMTLGYVGNHAAHVMSSRQFNPAVCPATTAGGPGVVCPTINNAYCAANGTCTAGNEANRRLYAGLGAVELADSYEHAHFNSLQTTVTRRQKDGLTLLGNIVWSKVMDNASGAMEGSNGPSNPFNLNSTYGPADFDQRIRANISANYVFPKSHSQGIVSALANGWETNVIYKGQSGLPFTITSGTDRSLTGTNNDYADVVPGVSTARPAGALRNKQYFNPAAFVTAALGTFGTERRNNLFGPKFNEIDFSLVREIFPESRIHGQLRGECFNLLNHPNFANPASSVSSGTYGNITATVAGNNTTGEDTTGAGRVFQLAAKILF